MRTLIPSTDRESWTVTGTGWTDDGPLDDVTVSVDRGPGASPVSIRTMRRTGTRLGPRGSVHGTVTDAVATAALAAGSLLLGAIPAGREKDETLSAMHEADDRANALARDRDGWDVTALPLDGIDYALFTRRIPEGTVAHADLGWATIAMWSAGALYEGPLRLAEVDPGVDPSAR